MTEASKREIGDEGIWLIYAEGRMSGGTAH